MPIPTPTRGPRRLKKCRQEMMVCYENEAGAAGSQQLTKGDLNKLYSAMQYEKNKHDNNKPLEADRALQPGKDKHSFWRNFLADKKCHTCMCSAKEGILRGG